VVPDQVEFVLKEAIAIPEQQDLGDRQLARLVFGREGDVYYSADHYKNFVQLRGKPHLNDPETAVERLRKDDPELWNQIEYLMGHFDEGGWTPTRQGGAWGFGVERSKRSPGELVNAPWRVRVPGKYGGGGLPIHRDGYYTEADVWPDLLRSQDH
jgi:hypothetical protein